MAQNDNNTLTGEVIGAAIEVHRILGPGYLESVYEDALCVEFELRAIRFSRQHPINISYKRRAVGESRLDLLVDNCLIIELKAVETLLPVHKAQVISYLRATGLRLGLLINFNEATLLRGLRRIILD